MTVEKFGVKNLIKIIAVPVELGNVTGKIIADKDSKWKKYLALLELVDEVGILLTVEWKKIKDEYMDLSITEKGEINEFMKEKFDLADDEIEIVIEDSFQILFGLEEAVKKSIVLAVKVKKLVESRKK